MWPWSRDRLPAAPLIERPDAEARVASMRLDPETETFVRTLATDGVATIDLGESGRALCDRVVAETEPYFKTAARVQDAWLQSRAVRRLAVLPKVRRMLAAAYGRKPFAFQTLNFHRGTQQEVHADTIHFHSVPERFMCGVWVALEDIRPEAGPLVYAPGSHRLPVMTMRQAGVNQPAPDYADYNRFYLPALHRQIAEAGLPPQRRATLKKGTALVWAANLAHGGAPIADPTSTRRSQVTHFYFEDCLYYTPMTSDVEGGRYDVRLPSDVGSRGLRWPRLNGRRVPMAFPAVKEAVRQRLFGKPHVVPL